MPRILAAAILLVLFPAAAQAAGKKAPDLSVSFHLQAGKGERHVFKQLTAGREVLYRKAPDITHKDFRAYRTFSAEDNNSYGIVFQLSKQAGERLKAISAANQGKLLLAVVNGQVRDAVVIDQPVNDGLIVIWKWMALAEVKLADQLLPKIGEDPKAWKKRIR